MWRGLLPRAGRGFGHAYVCYTKSALLSTYITAYKLFNMLQIDALPGGIFCRLERGRNMLQKDYWRMSEDELTQLADRYNIPPTSATKDPNEHLDAEFYFDRDRVIQSLVARDTALWAGRAIFIAVLSLLISLLALIVPLLLK